MVRFEFGQLGEDFVVFGAFDDDGGLEFGFGLFGGGGDFTDGFAEVVFFLVVFFDSGVEFFV